MILNAVSALTVFHLSFISDLLRRSPESEAHNKADEQAGTFLGFPKYFSQETVLEKYSGLSSWCSAFT